MQYHLRTLVVAIAGILTLGLATNAAAELVIAGFTNGCFGENCKPPSALNQAPITFAGSLTYNSSIFIVQTTGGLADVNLGSFSLSSPSPVVQGAHFNLGITFVAPMAPDVLLLDLMAPDPPSGGVLINFDNTPQHITFGSGPTFGTFDISVNDASIRPFETTFLTGAFSQTAAVPEPELYAMLLAGLGLLCFWRTSKNINKRLKRNVSIYRNMPRATF